MRLPTPLAIINVLTAATVLVVVAVTTDVPGMRVKTSVVVEATKQTDPALGLELLSRGVADWQNRTNVLKWLCYGTLPVLTLNAFCWAARRHDRLANPPLERTGRKE